MRNDTIKLKKRTFLVLRCISVVAILILCAAMMQITGMINIQALKFHPEISVLFSAFACVFLFLIGIIVLIYYRDVPLIDKILGLIISPIMGIEIAFFSNSGKIFKNAALALGARNTSKYICFALSVIVVLLLIYDAYRYLCNNRQKSEE